MNNIENLIFDVGMHNGDDTEFYLKKGFKVVAFEANPELIKENKIKFAKEIEDDKLIIVEGAIIDNDTDAEKSNPKIKFYSNKKLSVWGTVDSNWAKRNERLGTENEIIEVNKVNFKDCLQKYGIPYYLKIDIEGMDKVCLKSLLDFKEKPSFISIESEKVVFEDLIEEFDLFTKNGYTDFKNVNQASIKYQKEPNSALEGKSLNYQFKSGSTGLFGKDLPMKWVNKNKIILRYRIIFIGYKLFGDDALIKNKTLKKYFLKIIGVFTKQPIPGWYDTHAMHNSMK